MKRFDDWPTRLVSTIDAAQTRPFEWGVHDCCLFACDCILAMTGVDAASWFRGRYSSRETAVSALREYGGTLAVVAEQITEELGCPEVSIAAAHRGDVAYAPTELGDALGIIYDQYVWVPGVDGMVRLPINHALRVWAI